MRVDELLLALRVPLATSARAGWFYTSQPSERAWVQCVRTWLFVRRNFPLGAARRGAAAGHKEKPVLLSELSRPTKLIMPLN